MAIQGVNAQALLTALLQDTFLLPVYGDVTMPLHSLYQQYVAPMLEQVVSALLQGSNNKVDAQQQVQDVRQLVTKCYIAAVQGAEAEHAARRRHICRVLQEILLCLQVNWYCSTGLGLIPGPLVVPIAGRCVGCIWGFCA